ncbi:hypothetical protein V6N11_042641 [Hibiscus sabdariffa]|uniref:Cytochrome P450 n=1 Tax=Hibiscus sabdariffa TaxID=183260 RepID=A0ABR2QXG6_9ROSI
MELHFPSLLTLLASFHFLSVLVKILNRAKALESNIQKLPPGPWKLPLIGNLHQLVGSLPHRILRDLANRHGPLMHLQLGETSNIVVMSPEIAKEILITHGTIFAGRPFLAAVDTVTYSSRDIVMAPIDKDSYSSIVDEIAELASGFSIADLYPSSTVLRLVSGMSRKLETLFKKSDEILQGIIDKHRERSERGSIGEGEANEDLITVLLNIQQVGDHEITLTDNDIKAIIWWGKCDIINNCRLAMSEIMRNPRVLERAQNEQRNHEITLHYLCYFQGKVDRIVKLMDTEYLPRQESWSTHEPWEEIPSIGLNPRPFILKGRRMCPGIFFALASIELPLAKLLYHFDWKLPSGMGHENLDMTETFGVTVRRRDDLILIPIIHESCIR